MLIKGGFIKFVIRSSRGFSNALFDELVLLLINEDAGRVLIKIAKYLFRI